MTIPGGADKIVGQYGKYARMRTSNPSFPAQRAAGLVRGGRGRRAKITSEQRADPRRESKRLRHAPVTGRTLSGRMFDPARRVVPQRSLRLCLLLETKAFFVFQKASPHTFPFHAVTKGVCPMNCPYCGKEMEAGLISAGAGRRLVWTTKDYKLLPANWDKEAVDLPIPRVLEKTEPFAYLCRVCRKVVVDY